MRFCYIFIVVLFNVTFLPALDVFWLRLYPEVETAVYDHSGFRGHSNNQYLAIQEGLAHYRDIPDSLIGVYNYGMLQVVSVQVNEKDENEVFCALGSGSYSDGLYKFYANSIKFEIIEFAIFPNFIRKLTDGYYFGHSNGLMFSEDGGIWTEVEYFHGRSVSDIDEDSSGNVFISADSEIFINCGDSFASFDTGLTVRDIGKRYSSSKYGSITVSLSDGSYSDGIYMVDYDSGIITGLTCMEFIENCNKMCDYGYWFAVTILNSNQISLLGDENGINTSSISDDFNEIYFIQPDFSGYWSFIIGTDKGVYKGVYPMGIEDTPIPASTELHQNYPNPFNPETTIRYSLLHEADVKLTVFDIAGREVVELVSGSQSKGNYSVNFNAENLTSGICFYRLKVDGKAVQSRKMMMLK